MCEYCKKDGCCKRNKSLISKTLKNNVDIDLSINVKGKKLVASIENLTMNIEEDRWFLPTKNINYCPMCRKEAGRVKHITLKEMLETMVDCIINRKEYPTFYYKRQNYYTGNDEFMEITEIDLMYGRFKTVDCDFSEFSWELEKSNIYMKEDKQC